MDERLLKQIYNRFQPKLDNPVVGYEVVGNVGSTVYRYIVTAVGDSGETDGMVVEFVGPDSLSYTNYIVLSWNAVENAKVYRVYGRIGGEYFGFMVETEDLSFVDYGVIVPDASKRPPEKNLTGRLEWDRLLFLPGRYAQSAEMNELQSILEYHQARLARTLFNDGDVVSGCDIAVDLQNKKAYISAGKVFVRGRVRDVDEGEIGITASGLEKIGLKVEEVYIDADDDSVLLDPAQGFPGYASPGALRSIVRLRWVKDEPGMIVVYELVNGSVLKSYKHTRYSELEKTLAVRTGDISGDCVIWGLRLSVDEHPVRRDKLVWKLTSGKAYVDGYEVYKPLTYEFEENTAVEYDITVELVNPRSSGSYVYELDVKPVRRVLEVTGSFFESETRVVPNTTDENGWYIDTLRYFSIDEVVGLWNSSAKSYQYVENQDYRVVGNTVRLNPNVFEPGRSYYIEYYYFSSLVKGKRILRTQEDVFETDGSTREFVLSKPHLALVSDRFSVSVVLKDSNQNVVKVYRKDEFSIDYNRTEVRIGNARITLGEAPPANHYLEVGYYWWDVVIEGDYLSVDSYLVDDMYSNYWYEAVVDKNVVDLRTGGSKPDKARLIVRYEYFLPQRAYILLDKDGNVSLLRGYASLNPVFPPKPQGRLVLYEVYFPAFASARDVVVSKMSRYDVMKIYDMNVLRERVEKVEYDLAFTVLEIDAMRRETPAPKKAVFTDDFGHCERMDFEKCSVSIDSMNNLLLLPCEVKTYKLNVNLSLTDARVSGGVILKPYMEVPFVEQLVWTEGAVLSLNPYGVFSGFVVGEMYPTQQFWYEKRTVEEIVDSVNLTFVSDQVNVSEVRNFVARTLGVDASRIIAVNTGQSRMIFDVQGQAVYVDYEIVPVLKSQVVYFRLFSYPGLKFKVIFGNRELEVQSVSQSEINALGLGWTIRGSVANGRLVISDYGSGVGKFVIPNGFIASGGEVDVRFQEIDNPKLYAILKFKGYGRVDVFKRQNRRVVVSIVRPVPQNVVWGGVDPLAQTFVPPQDAFISSVDVWFWGVPQGNELCCMSIREVELGLPTDRVLGRSFKTTEQIIQEARIDPNLRILGTDPSETRGRVRFVFDPPVFVKAGREYAFTLDNSSSGFMVFAARVGKKVLVDLSGKYVRGQVLDRQAYDGVALMSVNGSSWESYQDVDLMFRINRASFNVNADHIVYFNDVVESNGIGEMVCVASELLPAGTELVWEWSKDGMNWFVFKPTVALNEEGWEEETNKINLGALVSSLKIRARLRSVSNFVSPLIYQESVQVFGGRYYSPGVYETKNVKMLQGVVFENVRLWFWFKANGGNMNSVKISFDAGNTWYDLLQRASYSVRVGWVEYEYGGSVSEITNNAISSADQFKLRIEFSSDILYMSPEVSKLRAVVY